MDLWKTRRRATCWLDNELETERAHLERGFELVDQCTQLFNELSKKHGDSQLGQFARVCGISTSKGRNLLLSCFSLAMDGLSQESGALLRPLLEVTELLTYLRLDPKRVEEVLTGKLPSAGNIAKTIDGKFKFLRDYLNEDASHFSFGFYSVFHLVDLEKLEIRPTESQTVEVLKRNLVTIASFFVFLISESISCLYEAGYDASTLAQTSEEWRVRTKTLFPSAPSK
jgi:hypothetical protein